MWFILRGINRYGDPLPWARRNPRLLTVLSFLNTTKYPPSLFLLTTLGPAMLFLRAVDGRTPRWLRPALTIGKVPMFYYRLHIPLICPRHRRVLCALWTHALDVRIAKPRSVPITPPPGLGIPPCRSSIWSGRFVVLALYPLCRRFAGLKQRSRAAWLSYF
jgi:hypothetical protein